VVNTHHHGGLGDGGHDASLSPLASRRGERTVVRGVIAAKLAILATPIAPTAARFSFRSL